MSHESLTPAARPGPPLLGVLAALLGAVLSPSQPPAGSGMGYRMKTAAIAMTGLLALFSALLVGLGFLLSLTLLGLGIYA